MKLVVIETLVSNFIGLGILSDSSQREVKQYVSMQQL